MILGGQPPSENPVLPQPRKIDTQPYMHGRGAARAHSPSPQNPLSSYHPDIAHVPVPPCPMPASQELRHNPLLQGSLWARPRCKPKGLRAKAGGPLGIPRREGFISNLGKQPWEHSDPTGSGVCKLSIIQGDLEPPPRNGAVHSVHCISICISLAALGLSCSTGGLPSSLRHAGALSCGM